MRLVGRAPAVLLLGCVALAIAACTRVGAPGERASGGRNPWTIPGVVRVALTEEPNTLVRMFSNQASADDVTALLFEPFFRYDNHERPVPALATTFPTLANGLISKDGLRITFPLRKGVLWSDGVPVTAADVIFTWHAIVDGRNPVVYTQGYDRIKTIVADNPYRVTFVMKQPFSPAVYLFSEGTFTPLPAHLLAHDATLNNIPYDAHPIGDGPFVLKRWVHGADLIFVANPHYWRGPPHVREIDMKVIPDPTTQVNELRTHEIDFIDGVSASLVGDLAGIPHIWIQRQLQANYRHLDFNLRNPILADMAVRQAIARAINVQAVIDDVYHGLGVRASTDIPPFSWAATGLPPIPYDPAAAARLLDADGWRVGPDGIRRKNGHRLSLSISSTTDNRPNADAEALVAQQLKAVGIDLTVKNYAGPVLFAEGGPLYGGRYDMSWIVNTEAVDPDNLAVWGCAYFPPHGANTDFYCNPAVDRYLQAAETTYDQRQRRADYTAAWRIMLHDVPSDILYWEQNVLAGNSDLHNVKAAPVITDFWNAWEWSI